MERMQFHTIIQRTALVALLLCCGINPATAYPLRIEFLEPVGMVIDDPRSWVVATMRVTNTSDSVIVFSGYEFDYSVSWTYGNFYDQYYAYVSGGANPTQRTLEVGESYDSEWMRLAPRTGSVLAGQYAVTSAGIARTYSAELGFIDAIPLINTFEWTVLITSEPHVPLPLHGVPEPSSLLLLLFAGLFYPFRQVRMWQVGQMEDRGGKPPAAPCRVPCDKFMVKLLGTTKPSHLPDVGGVGKHYQSCARINA
jgi:hypothetical protein